MSAGPGRVRSWTMAQAELWAEQWDHGRGIARSEIARRDGYSAGVVGEAIRCALGQSAPRDNSKTKHSAAYMERARSMLAQRRAGSSLEDIAESHGRISVSVTSRSIEEARKAEGGDTAEPLKRRKSGLDMREELVVLCSVFRGAAASMLGISGPALAELRRCPRVDDPTLDLEIQRVYAMARCLLLDVSPQDLAKARSVVAMTRRERLDELAEARS